MLYRIRIEKKRRRFIQTIHVRAAAERNIKTAAVRNRKCIMKKNSKGFFFFVLENFRGGCRRMMCGARLLRIYVRLFERRII